MLSGLSSVNWAKLTHAYGVATDVPDLIRALGSKRSRDRHEALDALAGNIWHQGSIYQATAFAVPFLVELLAEPAVEGKDGILELLAYIAVSGSTTDKNPNSTSDGCHLLDNQEGHEKREAKPAQELDWGQAVREAVEDGVPIYLGLLDDRKPKVRVFAAELLGHCHRRATLIIPQLIARASIEKNARSKANLILSIGRLRGGEKEREIACLFMGKLVEARERPIVRLVAAMGLVRVRPEEPGSEILETLTEVIGKGWTDFERLPCCDGDVAVNVGEALEKYPIKQLQFLLGLLNHEDPKIQNGGLFAVDKLCQERRGVTRQVAVSLREIIVAEDLEARRGAVELLSRLGSAASVAVDALGVALHDKDAQVRCHAAVALAWFREPQAIPVLVSLLKDDHLFTKVTKALSRFGNAAKVAVPDLLDVLKREPPSEPLLAHNRQIGIALTLGSIGSEARVAIPSLIELGKKVPTTQLAVAMALGKIGGNEARAAIPFLSEFLCSQSELVRIRGAQALWRFDRNKTRVLPVLIELLGPDMKNRSLAAEVMAELGELAVEGVPALRDCLQDQSFLAMWIRLKAAYALWRIERKPDAVLPVFMGLLQRPNKNGPMVATQAAEALGEMGVMAKQAVPLLRTAIAGDIRPFSGSVEDLVIQDEMFCEAVAEALRKIETA